MSHFTPGPWELTVRDHIGSYVIQDDANRIVAETRPPGNIRATGSEEANARLIAAAPDLLAACAMAIQAIMGMDLPRGHPLDRALEAMEHASTSAIYG